MTQRPYVFVNMATTADGKIDSVARGGARISGQADTVRVDRLRAGADAVMVGGRTLMSEDPRLTVRDLELQAARQRDGLRAQPAKIGVASRVGPPGDEAALLADGRFLNDGGGKVFICTTRHTGAAALDWLRARDVEVIVEGDEHVDLAACFGALSERGIERVMVEGGSTLVAALLEAGLVDELQLAVAPVLFGGETAPTPVGGPGWTPAEATRLHLADVATDDDGGVILRYLVVAGER